MIDAFYIFTKGGLLLWSTQLVKVKGDPVDKLIKEVLLEERMGETFATIQSYSLKWLLKNDLDVFFVVVYQGILTLAYVEGLLADAAKAFLNHIPDGREGLSALKSPYTVEFDNDWKKVLAKADKDLKESKRPRQMKTFDQTNKGKAVIKNNEEKGIDTGAKKKKKGSKGDKDDGSDSEDDDDDEASDQAGNSSEGKADEDAQAEARRKLKAKAKSGPGKFVPKEKKDKVKDEEEDSEKKKKGKEARNWDGSGKVTKAAMKDLDRSNNPNGIDDLEDDEKFIASQRALYQEGSDDEPFDDKEASSLDDDEDERSDPEEEEAEQPKKGLFSSLTRGVKNLTGGAVLTEQDLAPILQTFRTALMTRNVAAEVADKMSDSVRTSLIGKKTDRFTSMAATVKAVLQDAIETQLTPKKSIDVLRAALAAKNAGRVYTIVFLGVNGVGKSTNLAKVAYHLKHKGGLNVLICACDTFRAGAVEQLKTHSRCLMCRFSSEAMARILPTSPSMPFCTPSRPTWTSCWLTRPGACRTTSR